MVEINPFLPKRIKIYEEPCAGEANHQVYGGRGARKTQDGVASVGKMAKTWLNEDGDATRGTQVHVGRVVRRLEEHRTRNRLRHVCTGDGGGARGGDRFRLRTALARIGSVVAMHGITKRTHTTWRNRRPPVRFLNSRRDHRNTAGEPDNEVRLRASTARGKLTVR